MGILLLVYFFSVQILFLALGGLVGLHIAKKMSAMYRMVIQSLATFLVWGISFAAPSVFEQQFEALQLVGFLVILVGTLVFNRLVPGM